MPRRRRRRRRPTAAARRRAFLNAALSCLSEARAAEFMARFYQLGSAVDYAHGRSDGRDDFKQAEHAIARADLFYGAARFYIREAK